MESACRKKVGRGGMGSWLVFRREESEGSARLGGEAGWVCGVREEDGLAGG